jgi:hypothetical protein
VYWIVAAIMIAGALGSALSPSYWVLIAFRFLLGFGVGGDYWASYPGEISAGDAAETTRSWLTPRTPASPGHRQPQGLHAPRRPLPRGQPEPRRADPGFRQDLPQDRNFTAAITSALSHLLDQRDQVQPGQVTFLTRQ